MESAPSQRLHQARPLLPETPLPGSPAAGAAPQRAGGTSVIGHARCGPGCRGAVWGAGAWAESLMTQGCAAGGTGWTRRDDGLCW